MLMIHFPDRFREFADRVGDVIQRYPETCYAERHNEREDRDIESDAPHCIDCCQFHTSKHSLHSRSLPALLPQLLPTKLHK